MLDSDYAKLLWQPGWQFNNRLCCYFGPLLWLALRQFFHIELIIQLQTTVVKDNKPWCVCCKPCMLLFKWHLVPVLGVDSVCQTSYWIATQIPSLWMKRHPWFTKTCEGTTFWGYGTQVRSKCLSGKAKSSDDKKILLLTESAQWFQDVCDCLLSHEPAVFSNGQPTLFLTIWKLWAL